MPDIKQYKLNFEPNPIQQAFIESQSEADLFSARMGEGKSAGLCWAAFYFQCHNPGADWVMIRDTWENLRATTLKEFFYWFPPGVCGTWNEGRKTFTWASGMPAQGNVIWLGLDDPSDAGKLQSRFMGGFGMDEPAPALQSGGIPQEIFDIALTRLRQKIDGAPLRWYAAKLATNNPDELHWTYRRFVDPGEEGFRLWQSAAPENERHLPDGYYERMRRHLGHRADLVSRFIDGHFGLTQEGVMVTPEWSDRLHLSSGLVPVKGGGLTICWDFGLNPTAIITQVTPMRSWFILESMVGTDIGVEELIQNEVRPVLSARYKGLPFIHIVDPAGKQREQSSSARSALLSIRKELGGIIKRGPVPFFERREPLRSILSRQHGGKGVVQVDRTRAREVWQALRGGWHYHISKSGVPGMEPVKNIHSHPGDAMGYGAAVLFPIARLINPPRKSTPRSASFFGSGNAPRQVPKEGSRM